MATERPKHAARQGQECPEASAHGRSHQTRFAMDLPRQGRSNTDTNVFIGTGQKQNTAQAAQRPTTKCIEMDLGECGDRRTPMDSLVTGVEWDRARNRTIDEGSEQVSTSAKLKGGDQTSSSITLSFGYKDSG